MEEVVPLWISRGREGLIRNVCFEPISVSCPSDEEGDSVTVRI